MNLTSSSPAEDYRVFDLFSPNDWFGGSTAAPRGTESERAAAPSHVNPGAARDAFVFVNPLFAPARSEQKR
ncbi:MAG: hypothetical protein KBC32_03015 [Candidatus Didemnitutus sp.]|nr:hypothetical protein [Candidatus Didemnitutus sp.]